MTDTFPPRSAARSLRRARPPGETEFLSLFALLPQPAVLLDNNRESIVTANNPLLQLTAFTHQDVVGIRLSALLTGLPERPLTGDEVLSVLLERHNRTPLAVRMQLRSLDPAGQWVVALFEPEDDRHKNTLVYMEAAARALANMNRRPEETPEKSLQHALETARALLNFDTVAIYRVDKPGDPVTVRVVVGEENILPLSFPPNDLLRLNNPYIWKPGKRVQTELHRHARILELTCLTSVPTSQNGLLVFASQRQEPPEHLPMLVEALGSQISTLIDQLDEFSELRQAAVENQRELSVLKAVGENAQEGILLLATDLTVSEMNPAAEWMLGYADWEVRGQQVENIMIGPQRLVPALESALQGLPTHNMGSVSLHRRNGQSFPAHIQIVPVINEDKTAAIIVFFADVSENEEFRSRTQQLEQRAVLGEVTAVFAHEVRNPINNISTGLQLLSVKLPENDPNQENISRLINDCTRLGHLMESVLNFSRHVEHKFEPVNMEQLLRRLLDRWRPRMAKVNVNLFFQADENTPLAMADPRSIEQVFTNLISNAVDAMSAKGGTLAVRVAPFNEVPDRPEVEVTVSDNGPGIPDEIRERIFEPFVTTKAHGTGLGLAISKRIVTAHHGTLKPVSFPGGTVFQVVLSSYQGEAE